MGALARYGSPDTFNTGLESPFTARRFIDGLKEAGEIVSNRPDRDRLAGQARYWRAEEAKALKFEQARRAA